MKLTIKKAEAEIARLQKYIEESKPKGRFVPKFGEWYWCVVGDLCKTTNDNTPLDKWNIITGNYFHTEAEAKAYKQYKEALGRVTNYILDNHPFTPDWEDDEQRKWFILYDHHAKNLSFNCRFPLQDPLLLPYLPSQKACEQTIKECEDDLLIILNYRR